MFSAWQFEWVIKIKENNDDDVDDYYDDDDEVSGVKTPCFRGHKVFYMTFTKRTAKNLHYIKEVQYG